MTSSIIKSQATVLNEKSFVIDNTNFYNPDASFIGLNKYAIYGHVKDHNNNPVKKIKIEVYEVQQSKLIKRATIYTGNDGSYFYQLVTYDSEYTKTFKLNVLYNALDSYSVINGLAPHYISILAGVTKNTQQILEMRYGYYHIKGGIYRANGILANAGTIQVHEIKGENKQLIKTFYYAQTYDYVYETLEANDYKTFEVSVKTEMYPSSEPVSLKATSKPFNLRINNEISINLVPKPINVWRISPRSTMNFLNDLQNLPVFATYNVYTQNIDFFGSKYQINILSFLTVVVPNVVVMPRDPTGNQLDEILLDLKITTAYYALIPDELINTYYQYFNKQPYWGVLLWSKLNAFIEDEANNEFIWAPSQPGDKPQPHYLFPLFSADPKGILPSIFSPVVESAIGSALSFVNPEFEIVNGLISSYLTKVICGQLSNTHNAIADGKTYADYWNGDSETHAYIDRKNNYPYYTEFEIPTLSGNGYKKDLLRGFISVDFATWSFYRNAGTTHTLKLSLYGNSLIYDKNSIDYTRIASITSGMSPIILIIS